MKFRLRALYADWRAVARFGESDCKSIYGASSQRREKANQRASAGRGRDIDNERANRYEQLVGRGEKQADQIVNAGEPRVLCLDFPSLGIGDSSGR